MKTEKKLTVAEIEQLYPNRWVLVEETAWDEQGNPLRGVVRTQSEKREDLSTARSNYAASCTGGGAPNLASSLVLVYVH